MDELRRVNGKKFRDAISEAVFLYGAVPLPQREGRCGIGVRL